MQIFYILSLFASVFANNLSQININKQETVEIGRKIWLNECGGAAEKLVFWNPHEECLSLGIGHFIWYPKNSTQNFDAIFPQYLAFLKAKNVAIPAFIRSNEFAPWRSREEFLAATEEAGVLRDWLKDTIEWQTAFIITRLKDTLKKILDQAPPGEKEPLQLQINRLLLSPEGLFALIDYLNFKGSGLSSSERYLGQGWGLYQVLLGMAKTDSSVADFQQSAIARLTSRVENAPLHKNEKRWLSGWIQRINRYSESSSSSSRSK